MDGPFLQHSVTIENMIFQKKRTNKQTKLDTCRWRHNAHNTPTLVDPCCSQANNFNTLIVNNTVFSIESGIWFVYLFNQEE